MTYAAAVSALFALGHELAKPRKFDLAHMRALTEVLGNPQRRFSAVLVAGTNGKGSTSATLASILRAAGHRIALYTSPHLLDVNERIRVDGEAISDAEFTEIYRRVDEASCALVAAGRLPQHPSFFEMLTAMAFEYFASAGVEIAVLEVGMGGRLDATNVVDPAVSVITDIALDHQQYLGDTVTEIAREKAGILRPNGVMVTLPQHPEANDAIGHAALELGCRSVSAAAYVPNIFPGGAAATTESFDNLRPSGPQFRDFLRSRYFLEVLGEEVLIESPLLGRHQLRNVALAIAAAVELRDCGFRVTAKNVADGVRDTEWPGRFQLLPREMDDESSPDIILDVAHNPAGAWALRSTLSEQLGNRPLTLIFGGMKDKALGEMAEILFPLAGSVILTQAQTPRAATPEEVREAVTRAAAGEELPVEPTVAAALARARAGAGKNAVVVVTGSIYIVGEALAELRPQAPSGFRLPVK